MDDDDHKLNCSDKNVRTTTNASSKKRKRSALHCATDETVRKRRRLNDSMPRIPPAIIEPDQSVPNLHNDATDDDCKVPVPPLPPILFKNEDIPSRNCAAAFVHARNPRFEEKSNFNGGKWLIYKDNVKIYNDYYLSNTLLMHYKLTTDPSATYTCLNKKCKHINSFVEECCVKCGTIWEKSEHDKFTYLDIAWMKVAVNLVNGDLNGISAKASTGRSGSGVICVYTKDIFNQRDVLKTAQDIRDKLGIRRQMAYKPDMFTFLGIYSPANKPPPCTFDPFWEKKRKMVHQPDNEGFPPTMYEHKHSSNKLIERLSPNQVNQLKKIKKERQEWLKKNDE